MTKNISLKNISVFLERLLHYVRSFRKTVRREMYRKNNVSFFSISNGTLIDRKNTENEHSLTIKKCCL